MVEMEHFYYGMRLQEEIIQIRSASIQAKW